MNTLDLQSAAAFLGLHPNTLQSRAKAGEIPGAKVGKEWRFLEIDLIAFLRSQYPSNKRVEECRYTKSARSGTSMSRIRENELENLLAPPTGRKPNAYTTK